MKGRIGFLLVVLGAGSPAGAVEVKGPRAIEPLARWAWVIHGARLWTGGALRSDWDAVAISGGKIARVGRSGDLLALCAAGCARANAGGGFLMPGFHDSHAHLASGGAGELRVRVRGSSVSSIQSAVRKFAAANPASPWIVGRGWDAAGFRDLVPTRQDLDAAEAVRPVALIDSDGHQLWVNTAALAAADVTRASRDPEGGTVVRDSSGEPTGLLLENAADLVYDRMPQPTESERVEYITRGQRVALDAGVTSVQGGAIPLATARAYQRMDSEGKLHHRAFLWAPLEAVEPRGSRPEDEELASWVAWDHALPAGSRVRLTAFKGFVDGVISSHTAAMLEPYSDRPEVAGEPAIPASKLGELVLRANRAGYPVALHAIGDRAVRMALDAFESSARETGLRLANRVEHIESMNPADAPRFGALGVAASMQPSHMHFGSAASSYYPARLGPARLPFAFAWSSIQSTGGLLLFGTDFPVVDMDPLESISSAIFRQYGDGSPFFREQAVPPETALRGWTVHPAVAIGLERSLGRLEPGFEADLVVLREDPRLAREGSLGQNRPKWVFIGGIPVRWP